MEKTEVFVRAFRVRLALGMFVPELRKSVKLVPPLFRLYRGWINVSEGERYVPWIILLLVLAGVIGGDCVGELRIAVFLSQAVYNRHKHKLMSQDRNARAICRAESRSFQYAL